MTWLRLDFFRNYAEDRNINTDSDSHGSIVIIDEVNADDVGEIKDIKTEIPRTSMKTNFLMDQSVFTVYLQ